MMTSRLSKKLFSLILAVVMIAGLAAYLPGGFITVHAESGTCGANLTWTLEDGVLTINGSGRMNDYSDFSAPWKSISFSKVIINSGVTSIGDGAFSGCTGLTSIMIPNSVTSIGSSAFWRCTGLTSVTIPDSVTSIGDYAFRDCTGLTSVTMGKGVTSIGGMAFFHCYSLSSITLPNSLVSIGAYAFESCGRLNSITIPESVTNIERKAFYDTGYYNSTSNWRNKMLYLGNWLIAAQDDIYGTVFINNGTVGIAGEALENCSGLTGVTIPNSVTSIGEYAFSGCGLTSATIPDNVSSIGVGAFACAGLKSVSVSSGNTVYHSVNNCIIETGSKTLVVGCRTSVIPTDGSVTSIGSSAFRGCTGLMSITIPDSVTSIGSSAFRGCTGLMSITIPDSVTSIGGSAFSGCTGLTSVTIPDSVTSIGIQVFMECTGLTSVTIGSGVTSISSSAFYNCTGLASVTIPDSVTSIGIYSFLGCTSLTSLIIPDSVTDIGDYAFYNSPVELFVKEGSYAQEYAIANSISYTIANKLLSISISCVPTKTRYLEGKDELDVSGGEIELFYDNDTYYMNMTLSMVSGFDNNKVGTQTLTVSFGGKTATFEIEIVAKSLTRIEITTLPYKTEYLEGKENLDTNGGRIKLYYNNGSSKSIAMTASMVSGFDNNRVGSQVLLVTYEGVTATFSVTIIGKQLSDIAVTTLPNKLQYLVGKDSLDITGGVLTLYYDNDTTRDAYMVYNNGYKLMFADDFTLADLTVTGFDNTEVGTKTIVVRYGGKSTTFNVEILDKTLIRFEMTSKPAKTEYIKGEQLDLSGVAIKLYYDNGEVQTASVISVMGNHRMIISGSSSSEEIVVDGFFGNNSGRQTVTLTYNGCSDSFVVKVRGENVIYGDPDGDGEIGVTDALMSMRAVLGIIIVVDGDVFIAADVDDDGLLTISDALRVLRMAAGLPVTRFSI